MCGAFAKTLDDDVVHAPVRRRAPDQQRLEPTRESDATLVEQCPSCGLTVTGTYHRDGAACISALRDVLGELQLRTGAVVCAILRPHTEAHGGLGRPKRHSSS
jgi:hypothetical protein